MKISYVIFTFSFKSISMTVQTTISKAKLSVNALNIAYCYLRFYLPKLQVMLNVDPESDILTFSYARNEWLQLLSSGTQNRYLFS